VTGKGSTEYQEMDKHDYHAVQTYPIKSKEASSVS